MLAAAANVCDALFTDLTGDGRPDLLTVGEWEPPRLFINGTDGWREAADAIPGGWNGLWNSLVAADLDGDGDLDVVAGNYGTNSILRATPEHPATAMLTDIDMNGTLDFVPFRPFRDRQGNWTVHPFFSRNDFAKQTTKIKGLYGTHAEYATATSANLEPADDRETYRYRVDRTESVVLYNEGGNFRVEPLPPAAQSFPVYGVLPVHLNADPYIDLLMVGNDYGGESSQGYLDAGDGLVLLGGAEGFTSLTPDKSGWYVPGEGRGIVMVATPSGPRIVAAQNSGPLVVVEPVGDYRRDTDGGLLVGGYLSQSSHSAWVRLNEASR